MPTDEQMSDTPIGTIQTPLRWDGQSLYAGTIIIGWIMRGAGAEPSWLGLKIGCQQVYHGPSEEAARAAVERAATWALAGEVCGE